MHAADQMGHGNLPCALAAEDIEMTDALQELEDTLPAAQEGAADPLHQGLLPVAAAEAIAALVNGDPNIVAAAVAPDVGHQDAPETETMEVFRQRMRMSTMKVSRQRLQGPATEGTLAMHSHTQFYKNCEWLIWHNRRTSRPCRRWRLARYVTEPPATQANEIQHDGSVHS